MKRIGLLSDTHSYFDEKIYDYFSEVDEIWHAGDIGSMQVVEKLEAFKPLRAVYGNIDNATIRAAFPLNNIFMCEEMKVWITHIGGYPGRYNSRVREDMKATNADVFITGHSHILKIMPDRKNDLLHINPGAAGISGFHKIKTMVRFAVDGRKIKAMEVIELGKRGQG
ncbi:MAG: metallophosphoesterase family protein [Saprospiraceae bacterium]|jgi:putative phosphoesterase|nr:metallophosphatase family protein [Saprospiraceae bacterium]MDB4768651.1 metallophosphatase family protein [Saprospiraceae bacterium]MDG1433041.1 metallophosphoesterase family protein [Saprospiraceae bacterium]MDG2418690.1 metallophosphoesterase family protein [Saprospiraceae bacterium]